MPRSAHALAVQRLAKALTNRSAACRALTACDDRVADAMLLAAEAGITQREMANVARAYEWAISPARVSQLVLDARERAQEGA